MAEHPGLAVVSNSSQNNQLLVPAVGVAVAAAAAAAVAYCRYCNDRDGDFTYCHYFYCYNSNCLDDDYGNINSDRISGPASSDNPVVVEPCWVAACRLSHPVPKP